MDSNMTFVKYLPIVVAREPCKKHNAVVGVPCYDIFTDTAILPGICDQRARNAGFDEQPTTKSLGKDLIAPRKKQTVKGKTL